MSKSFKCFCLHLLTITPINVLLNNFYKKMTIHKRKFARNITRDPLQTGAF